MNLRFLPPRLLQALFGIGVGLNAYTFVTGRQIGQSSADRSARRKAALFGLALNAGALWLLLVHALAAAVRSQA